MTDTKWSRLPETESFRRRYNEEFTAEVDLKGRVETWMDTWKEFLAVVRRDEHIVLEDKFSDSKEACDWCDQKVAQFLHDESHKT